MVEQEIVTINRAGVLLIIPPAPFLAFPNAAPHLGIGFILAYLRSNGIRADLLNAESAVPDEIVLTEGYGYYALTSVTAQYYFTLLLLDQIRTRKLGKSVIGGAHASIMPQECLADGFDYVVTGYGETALLEIARNRVSPGLVQGIALGNIDSVGMPAWADLMTTTCNKAYGNRTAHLLTMRGCPYGCRYCCSPFLCQRVVHYRNIDAVLREVAFLVENYKIDSIQFMDPCFTVNKKRAVTISSGLGDLNLRWTCQTRVDLIDEKLLAIMFKSGCDKISFGVETGAQAVFSLLNKQTSILESETAIRMAHDVGMKVKAYLMGGLPWDSENSFEETKKFVIRNRFDDWLYSTFIPFPGTEMGENPGAFGMRVANRDWRAYYPLGLNARGPLNIDGRYLSRDRIGELRDDMIDFLREEIPNPRVEEAIRLFPTQKKRVAPYFSGLDWRYLAGFGEGGDEQPEELRHALANG